MSTTTSTETTPVELSGPEPGGGAPGPGRRGPRESRAAFMADLGPLGLLPLLILVGLAGVQSFDSVAFGVLSPDIRRAFGLGNAGIDVIASLTGAVPIIFAVGLGYLGDRSNRIKLSRYAGLIWGATAILTGLAPVVAILIVARIIGGVGLLTSETVYPSLLSDWYPPKGLPKVFSVFRFAGQGLGLLGGPLAGAIGAAFGWRTAFVVLALPTFVLVACLSFLKEPARGASQGLTVAGEQLGSILEGFRRVRAIRTLKRTWIAAFLFGAGTVPFATLLNNFFKDVYHQGDAARGGITVIFGVGGLVGILIGGYLTQRVIRQGRPALLSVVNGLLILEFGAGIVLMAGSPIFGLSLIGAGILSIGAFGFLPAYTTLVSLVAPPRLRAQAYGWSLFFYALGAIVLSAVIGGIASAHGDRTSLLVLAAIVAIGGLVGTSTRRFVDQDIRAATRVQEAQSSTALMSCRGVDAAYTGVQILFGVDFEIQKGEMVALLGTNGAGKSTFLKAISGLLDPIGGVITFKGRDITHTDPQTTARLGIVQVPGGRGIFPGLSVADNLKVAGWLYRKDKAYLEKAMAEVLEYFPILKTRSDTLAGSLSGGEQQQLSLGQAFLAQPELLLIDELSLGLAPAIVTRLMDIVRAIHDQGTTVILVEQSVTVALQLAQRAIFMEKGEVRFSGPTGELLNRPDILRAVFLKGSSGVELTDEEGPQAGERAAITARSAEEKAAVAEEAAAKLLEGPVVLETRGLVKRYGGVTAVNGVDIQLHQGEILGFIGANGAGKTTLFDLISGFSPANAGHVFLHGTDVSSWPAFRRAAAGLGRSFQDARLWPALTVAESLAVSLHDEAEVQSALPALLGPARLAESEAALSDRVNELIELMGLEAFRNKFISELSTGSRRMVELACMLGHRPSVLILDEPSSGIAQRETEALGPLIRRIRAQLGCSVLIIEHDIPLISGLADHLVGLELGGVIAYGRPEAVLTNARVVESYLGGPAATTGAGAAPNEPGANGARANGAGANGARARRAAAGTSAGATPIRARKAAASETGEGPRTRTGATAARARPATPRPAVATNGALPVRRRTAAARDSEASNGVAQATTNGTTLPGAAEDVQASASEPIRHNGRALLHGISPAEAAARRQEAPARDVAADTEALPTNGLVLTNGQGPDQELTNANGQTPALGESPEEPSEEALPR